MHVREKTIFTNDGEDDHTLGGSATSSEILDDPINLFLELSSDKVSILFGISYSSATITKPEGETYD
jgi:hypothetical protein